MQKQRRSERTKAGLARAVGQGKNSGDLKAPRIEEGGGRGGPEED